MDLDLICQLVMDLSLNRSLLLSVRRRNYLEINGQIIRLLFKYVLHELLYVLLPNANAKFQFESQFPLTRIYILPSALHHTPSDPFLTPSTSYSSHGPMVGEGSGKRNKRTNRVPEPVT